MLKSPQQAMRQGKARPVGVLRDGWDSLRPPAFRFYSMQSVKISARSAAFMLPSDFRQYIAFFRETRQTALSMV
jgi:hypothetical protein